MARKSGLKREHVLQAIKDLKDGAFAQYSRSAKYELLFEGNRYAPKAVLARAMYYCSGSEPALKSFSGGIFTNSMLSSLGFEIVSKH